MPHWKLYYHLVWSTWHREPTIDAVRERRIRDSVRLTCSELSVVEYELGIMPDHMHMFVALPPSIAVSKFVQHIKGDSSRYMNVRDRSTTFRWQREYGAYSIHENQIPRLLEYIRRQAEHHATNQLQSNLEITERPY